jgi:hypothetical protein
LDSSAELVLRLAGGSTAHSVSAGAASWDLPAHRMSSVRFPAPAGYSAFALATDWTSTVGAPRIVAAELRSGGRTIPLL